ncbi:Uncharacterized protein conserved in bacteria [Gemella morbillorum]|jgi:hypothetical protein|uniref:DUF2129 domain-containing protein n=2 Tax=Gemella morbillorum TaxID=29391 RepID=A0A2X4RDL7_9BACL|nr:DUF2129 domain-containing protein [Gemella morbillorum]EFV35816.1 hypothetical protein HMPREF0432_00494 [Gemella morbillorum M424]MBF1210318.1 DUF2129 domain-containing protein [Gemella morbillorum]MBF1212766.1 DUF2129 domain-containing protein [Gemella morbillorum]MDK8239751.1 DUF2129 domain-containing protein [Gemella morbillorum]QGS09715.1 DUF2129 domain-containing protein [Gemella morbillorum]
MELFEKERRGIYVYFKSFKDLSKLEKYGNFISYSKRGRYACIYVDENRMDSIIEDLKKKKFVKKIEISEMSNLHLSFENLEKMSKQHEIS